MNQEQWVVVYETFGSFKAELIVGRLQAEGVPARFWAESAGRAFGISIGKLGTAYIEVPESFTAQAKEIIDIDFTDDLSGDDEFSADGEIENDMSKP